MSVVAFRNVSSLAPLPRKRMESPAPIISGFTFSASEVLLLVSAEASKSRVKSFFLPDFSVKKQNAMSHEGSEQNDTKTYQLNGLEEAYQRPN